MLPLYLERLTLLDLKNRAEQLLELQKECRICPHECLAKRHDGVRGDCNSTDEIIVSSIASHFGEEPPLVGTNGSGTIFFTNCNLSCEFCQNYDISHSGVGSIITTEQLSLAMLKLQNQGCHNINLVTPTHFTPQIVAALSNAIEHGLEIPLVYNCGGYESLDVIRALDGIVDIYMPDIKFLIPDLAKRYCNAPDYPEVVREVIHEMQRQAGDLVTDENGIARRGLVIRHLVMPSLAENTREVLSFIRHEISQDAFVNIMAQYHPCYQALEYQEIARRPTMKEYAEAVEYARKLGLTRAEGH